MTRDLRGELIDIVYEYYPRGVLECTDDYRQSVEHERLRTAARRGAAKYPKWEAMLSRLGGAERIQGRSLVLLAGWAVPGYDADMWLEGNRVLGFHVSLLGAYYGVHRTGAPEEEPFASEIAREIEATYPGYVEIPPEIGNEVVPDIGLKVFGETKVYHCVLSDEWDWSSGVVEKRIAPLPEVDASEEAEEEPPEPE